MAYTLHVDDSNPRAKAFLEFVKTLDFIRVDEDEISLSQEQIEAIQEGIESLEKHGGIPHEQVMAKMKTKYPKFFRA